MDKLDINNLPPEKRKLAEKLLEKVQGGNYAPNAIYEMECRSCGMPSMNNAPVCAECGSTDVLITWSMGS